MPYLISPSAIGTKLILVLAFGDLSHLEACTIFADQLSDARRLTEDILAVDLRTTNTKFEGLAGVHKVAIPITPSVESPEDAQGQIEEFLKNLNDNFSFSVSYYSSSSQKPDKSEYEVVVSTILEIIRGARFRKANLIRSRDGTEVHAKEIAARKIIDFVILRMDNLYQVGVTIYVPDTAQFRVRSNERPVVSSEISISSRLAKVLLNLSNLKKGDMLLDPFCGSGTILAEAILAGINCVGVDKNPISIENAKLNLKWVSTKSKSEVGTYSLMVGDATKLEYILNSSVPVDGVVTEPILLPRINYMPNLTKARRMVRNASRLYSDSLYSISALVRSGGRIAIVAPSLRTSGRRDVSVTIEDLDSVGLRPFNLPTFIPNYPVRIGHENTKWLSRMIYLFERT
jgi:tRNA G10  N-methylase Trm11